ncbi:MAG: DUF4230 domain-containing protein [Candidatus Gastranaerophilales bacterium]|nr:DUF4230 domain-containing protein [Candidatus Gastranaerophilales bacterium]
MWKKQSEREEQKTVTGIILIAVLTVIIIAAFAIWYFFFRDQTANETVTVVTSAQLEKVLQISELSTYKVTYNGVASVSDDKDTLLYYVAYEADVSIGIAMEQIRVEVDETDAENKKIVVTLPEVEIVNVDIDPGTLDYIFEKKSADTEDVSATAIPACRADAREECLSNETLFELAKENAANTINALMKPLMEQYGEYALTIVDEEGNGYE